MTLGKERMCKRERRERGGYEVHFYFPARQRFSLVPEMSMVEIQSRAPSGTRPSMCRSNHVPALRSWRVLVQSLPKRAHLLTWVSRGAAKAKGNHISFLENNNTPYTYERHLTGSVRSHDQNGRVAGGGIGPRECHGAIFLVGQLVEGRKG
jgi:hypothetical protein